MAVETPVLVLTEVAHVGEMRIDQKRPGSYEGSLLSVSRHPATWSRIARLGGRGFILEGRGRFLDALELTKAQRAEIEEWAIAEGLIERVDRYEVSYFDGEAEEWRRFECATAEAAREEAEEFSGEEVRVSAFRGLSPTNALLAISGGPCGEPISDLVFDFALMAWAARDLGLDGVWWSERLDPGSLSAPRGGLFPDRLADYAVRSAEWAELELAEERWSERVTDAHPGSDFRLRPLP